MSWSADLILPSNPVYPTMNSNIIKTSTFTWIIQAVPLWKLQLISRNSISKCPVEVTWGFSSKVGEFQTPLLLSLMMIVLFLFLQCRVRNEGRSQCLIQHYKIIVTDFWQWSFGGGPVIHVSLHTRTLLGRQLFLKAPTAKRTEFLNLTAVSHPETVNMMKKTQNFIRNT